MGIDEICSVIEKLSIISEKLFLYSTIYGSYYLKKQMITDINSFTFQWE